MVISNYRRAFFTLVGMLITFIGDVNAFSATTSSPSSPITTTISSDADESSAFSTVASYMADCLFQSDIKKDAKFVGSNAAVAAKGAGNWVDDASAYALKSVINQLEFKLADARYGLDRDEAGNWIRWMKIAPAPLVVELSGELRSAANETLSDDQLEIFDAGRDEYLSRLGCRLILLPSGAELNFPLKTPSGGMSYGKLLYGGVKRFRLLPGRNGQRRASENSATKVSAKDNVPCWLQYGGPDRKYEAIDMGSCAVVEFTILPSGQQMPPILSNVDDMAISKILWNPTKIFSFGGGDENLKVSTREGNTIAMGNDNSAISLSGRDRNDAFEKSFKMNVGGLKPQIETIVRRVLDGRIIKPAGEDLEVDEDGDPNKDLTAASIEAEALKALGLTPVRGLLLYGPPGCGKTALAREISKSLKARAPKIVSTPELLDRWVGGSEKLVRNLFAEAEAELASVGGDARKSALHVVVLDEIDAVFRKRTAASDSGEATRSSAVNQILAKLDGVNAIPNVLVIGMTNRRELLDEALLRPGRLEVQIEIPLPNRDGRREIFQIHFDALRRMGRLSTPLCMAIDGVRYMSDDSTVNTADVIASTEKSRRKRFLNSISRLARPAFDLADDTVTNGFSGADIAGLVRCAGSIALSRAREDGSGVEGLMITLDDIKDALIEVKL